MREEEHTHRVCVETLHQFTSMAGVTSTLPFKPLLFTTLKPPPLLSLSSYDSNVFGFRLCTKFSSLSRSISARYSGGGRYHRPSYGDSWSKQATSEDDDEALDISSLRSDKVRLLDQQQNMVGVMSKNEAIEMAEEAELDLVILSPDADPPVARIMDYNKYKYELQKKKKGQQKKSVASQMGLKVLKMGYNIDAHDYSVRLKAALKFLKEGDKVKIIVNLKGRENQFRNNGIELLRRFQNDVGEFEATAKAINLGTVGSLRPTFVEGIIYVLLATEEAKSLRDRNMFVVLIPNKVVVQKAQALQKEKENPVEEEVSQLVSEFLPLGKTVGVQT